MKYSFFILTIVSTLACFAQDQRLFDNTWYLQKVIVSGVEHFPPSPNDFVTDLDISLNSFICTHTCFSDFLGWNVDDVTYTNSDFNLNISPIIIGDGCALNQEIIDFVSLHFEHYYVNSTDPLNPFTYNIDDSGNILLLTVTNINGDDAIYGNELLSVNEVDYLDISILPNPFDEILLITCKCDNIETMRVIDISGKVILEYNELNFSNTQRINVAHLKSGIYFLTMHTDGGQITKRIIKK